MTTPLRDGFTLGGFLPDILTGPVRFSTESGSSDEFWMKEALRESMKGIGLTSPNPSVGCILVRNGKEVARGHTQPYGGKHAERVAFDALPSDVNTSELTAYVTLEPCCHLGKQPPCSDLFSQHRPARVVIATRDPNPLVSGKGIEKILAAGISVNIGVLEAEVRAWLSPFLTSQTTGKVMLAGKWGQTLDGHLADDSSASQWITGSMARAYSHWLRQKYDVVVVGAGTVLKDLPLLTVRDCLLPANTQPIRLIFDPRGKILHAPNHMQTKLLEKTFSGDRQNVLCAPLNALDRADRQWKFLLETKGNMHFMQFNCFESVANNLSSALHNTDWNDILGKPLQSAMVEGGPWLLARLLEVNALSFLHVSVAPFFLGASKNKIAQATGIQTPGQESGSFPHALQSAIRHKLISTAQLDNDVLMEYACQEG